MERPYRLRRILGKVLHEDMNFIVSHSIFGDRLEVMERSTRDVRAATVAQRRHLSRCVDALRLMKVPAEPGSAPFEVLVEDFAGAVFCGGLQVDRAFFKNAPATRAYSAVVRCKLAGSANVDDLVYADSEDCDDLVYGEES
jgi:hypothetical protein